jgi:hypothetical protein
MTIALRTRSITVAAAAMAVATLPACATARDTPTASASSGDGFGTVGHFTGDTQTSHLANLDATSNAVIAVVAVPGEGWDKATATSGRVWFSRLDDTPTALSVDPVPSWAQPHWGTDATGRRVAVYPRCAGGTLKDCDLYAWDADANKERRLDEVDRPGVGEVEGTMDRGAIAYTTQTASTASASAAKDPVVSRTLWLRRVGKSPLKLSSKGGDQLALHSGIVAQDIPLTPETASDGDHRVQLVRAGKPTRVVLAYGAGMNARHVVGMRFFGSEVRFGLASLEDDYLYRGPVAGTKKARGVKTTFEFTSLAYADTDTLAYVGESAENNSIPLFTRDAPRGAR